FLEATLEATLAHIDGVEGRPMKRAVVTQGGVHAPKAPASPMLSAAVSEFIRDGKNLRGWSDAMERAARASLALLIGLVGDKPVRDVSKDDMRQYQRDLEHWPRA